ncbi:hypothetical protein [Pseudomonas chlororaphis]
MAEPTFVERIEGAAAQCSITGSGNSTEAFIARRDYGETSKKYKSILEKAYSESKACVDAEKPRMKPYLKSEIAKYPQLKPAITEAYAAWLGYMDWLSSPRDWADESPEKTSYEAAVNRLKAEIDTM